MGRNIYSCRHVLQICLRVSIYPSTADGGSVHEHSPVINNTEMNKLVVFVHILSSFPQDPCLQDLKRLVLSVAFVHRHCAALQNGRVGL